MTDEKKKGFFAKLFGGCGGDCCCNVRIEEVADNEPEKPISAETGGQDSGKEGKPSAGPKSQHTGDDRTGDRA